MDSLYTSVGREVIECLSDEVKIRNLMYESVTDFQMWELIILQNEPKNTRTVTTYRDCKTAATLKEWYCKIARAQALTDS